MNGFGPHNSLENEMNYRVGELQREAKQARLRKAALQADAKPALFKRLTLSLMTLLKTTHTEATVAISNENLSQPSLKRTTATFSKV